MTTEQEIIGFIGLGNVGAPIAERIVKNGFQLIVWNRTPAKMQPLLTLGAKGARSARELAQQASIVFTCVNSAAALEDVLFGSDGITSDAIKVSLVVDISTLSPHVEREFGQRLREQTGAELIDVPFSGGAAGARAGTLAAIAGGATGLLERARPVIECYASRITHMGPLGAGQAAKACNQIISMGTMGAIAEAIALGEHYGIDTQQLATAVSGGFADSNLIRELQRSYAAQNDSPIRTIIDALIPGRLENIDPECQYIIALVLKDLGIALDMARDIDFPLPLTARINSRFHFLYNKS